MVDLQLPQHQHRQSESQEHETQGMAVDRRRTTENTAQHTDSTYHASVAGIGACQGRGKGLTGLFAWAFEFALRWEISRRGSGSNQPLAAHSQATASCKVRDLAPWLSVLPQQPLDEPAACVADLAFSWPCSATATRCNAVCWSSTQLFEPTADWV